MRICSMIPFHPNTPLSSLPSHDLDPSFPPSLHDSWGRRMGSASLCYRPVWFRVAAENPSGVGTLVPGLPGFQWRCSAPPGQPDAPFLKHTTTTSAVLQWVTPDLHGATLTLIIIWYESCPPAPSAYRTMTGLVDSL